MKFRLIVFLPLLLSGCGAAARGDSDVTRVREHVRIGQTDMFELTHDVYVNETTLPAARPKVWQAVLSAHQALGLPMVVSNAERGRVLYRGTGLIGSIAQKRMSSFLDCGSSITGARADTYQIDIQVLEVLDSVAVGRTRLQTQILANARSTSVSGNAVHCESTTQLEKLISTMVAARLEPSTP